MCLFLKPNERVKKTENITDRRRVIKLMFPFAVGEMLKLPTKVTKL